MAKEVLPTQQAIGCDATYGSETPGDSAFPPGDEDDQMIVLFFSFLGFRDRKLLILLQTLASLRLKACLGGMSDSLQMFTAFQSLSKSLKLFETFGPSFPAMSSVEAKQCFISMNSFTGCCLVYGHHQCMRHSLRCKEKKAALHHDVLLFYNYNKL